MISRRRAEKQILSVYDAEESDFRKPRKINILYHGLYSFQGCVCMCVCMFLIRIPLPDFFKFILLRRLICVTILSGQCMSPESWKFTTQHRNQLLVALSF